MVGQSSDTSARAAPRSSVRTPQAVLTSWRSSRTLARSSQQTTPTSSCSSPWRLVATGCTWGRMSSASPMVQQCAQRVIDGSSVLPVGFAPGDADRVLLTDDSSGQVRPVVWTLSDDSVRLIEIDVAGEAEATWYPDGSALLVTVLDKARHTLQRYRPGVG